jgi:outer membrane protein assembly factor BamA
LKYITTTQILSLRPYLIFFFLTITVSSLSGQQLKLKINSEDQPDTRILDSLGYKTYFKNYNALEVEIKKVVDQLWRIGYIDTTVEAISKRNDSLYEAQLFMGKRLSEIRINYTSEFDTELLQGLGVNIEFGFFDLKIDRLENTLQKLNERIAEKGDPFSTIQLTNLKKTNTEIITADLNIITNQKRRIDNIVVKGYDKFPKSFIKRYLKLQEGKPFNLREIQNNVQLLENLNFASKIKDPEVLFTTDSTTLYLYIEKVKTNNFDGFLGFGTNETTNKLDFDGYLDLRLINNLNYGETLNLYYKSDEIDQQTFRVDIDLPYLFASPVGLELGLNIFRKDSTFLNARQKAKIHYQINALQRIAAGIDFTNSTNLLDSDTSIIEDYRSNFYTINYRYIKPQFYDPLFPVNFHFDLSLGFGQRETDTDTQSQNSFQLHSYKIFNLNTRNSIFLRATGALLQSERYFDNELYRFGGINSIRGFEENSLVANLYGVVNTEYRYRLSSSLYVHSVFDAAYYENDLTKTKEKLFGFGFGFGLLTNTGLFRLNYSSGKSENRAFRFADSKVHISLTATF